MAERILIVEDEENLLEGIKLNLELEGYEVIAATDGIQAVETFTKQRFDLVILDVMLPELSGFNVCERIRFIDSHVPVLFLTAKDTMEDKLEGFKIGADDYMVKPFNLQELLLRVKALLKRSVKNEANGTIGIYKFGGNTINFNTFEVIAYDKTKYKLTKREAAFLKILVDHKNEVVSRQHILQSAWNYDVLPNTRTIYNFISNFRKYFEKDPRHPKHFFSIRGVGYQFKE
jgi:two-component system alkaline phosphatase synthesis response regulator PhoP